MSRKKRNEIRKQMKAILHNLDARWVRAASSKVCKHLSVGVDREFDESISDVLAWTRFFPGEVDLSTFVNQQVLLRNVFMPRSLPDHSMSFVRIRDGWREAFEDGAFGIPEPSTDSASLYDPELGIGALVLVPGLAFDRLGNRLGRGKGYYDRFLARPEMAGAIKVGISFSLSIIDEIPTEPHDVPMDWICHEQELLRTGVNSSDDLFIS